MGWFRRATARASRSNRSRNVSSLLRCGYRILIATGRARDSWMPSKTTPIPPRAMNRVIRKPLNDRPMRLSIPRLSSITMLPSGDPNTPKRYRSRGTYIGVTDISIIAQYSCQASYLALKAGYFGASHLHGFYGTRHGTSGQ
ncbi:hypothetical protein NITHO_3900002 [Nitrolancea hollandica Lb]|uniref:Uncharacterized protein n=1 Tax=Nitrolancea hollandica Lb TaxID=1129897 RepID=I4EJA5_9BACT|nr:hypothetical protein NITHO_3900002 [Nitrolancea hollandica Lb]